MSKLRMGGMGKLRDFSTTPTGPVPEPPELEQRPEPKPKTTAKTVSSKAKKQDKLITVNIKIREQQQEWLADTARQVRGNNDEPVPPAERCYPQHLIQVAIDLLKTSDVDWDSIQNVEDLRKALEL
ncbi:hypothetical protein [Leptolyngbya sp. FACHB-711]|uniref:hypothetical protein n=1 Tax=Leptolyngbya sp. FACHB-711 TaxID=2692813 RepID=UPI001683E14D|nr:hypothetical protein [Leptolyngbya sp. FACHB-711]MBD2025238.1 hypothetical protein [Leptolyngbya sp. FACHB-711]